MFSTDQGALFASEAFTERLKEEGKQISKDGKIRWRDNAFVERLRRGLKYEHVHLHAYKPAGDARHKSGSDFEFYHSRRPHSSPEAQTSAPITFTVHWRRWRHNAQLGRPWKCFWRS